MFHLWAGPTELNSIHVVRNQSALALRKGTSTAPSRSPRYEQWLPGSWPTHSMRNIAWDKIPRLGEAQNPGPEPPGSCTLTEKMDRETPFDCAPKIGGGSGMYTALVAKRATPHEALRNCWPSTSQPSHPRVLQLPGS